MPTSCLQTGGSVTLDVKDAKGVMHHILVALHPQGEGPLNPSGRFFRTYMGGTKERAVFLGAIMAAKKPTVPVVLYAKRACIPNAYGAVTCTGCPKP